MKTYYVYELINLYGTIEYVGESTNIERRFKQHTKAKPTTGPGHGKFYGRQDLRFNIVDQFNNRKEATDLEELLKKEYGFELTEKNARQKNAKKASMSRRSLDYNTACEIRDVYKNTKTSYNKLAKQYNTTKMVILCIINNLTYKEA